MQLDDGGTPKNIILELKQNEKLRNLYNPDGFKQNNGRKLDMTKLIPYHAFYHEIMVTNSDLTVDFQMFTDIYIG